MENKNPISIYDRKVSGVFEDWIIESGVKIKFNTLTYYFDTEVVSTGLWDSMLVTIGLRDKCTRTTMHVVTNMPGPLIGRAGTLIDKYRSKLIELIPDLDDIQLHEVKSPDNFWKGIRRKLKDKK